MKVRLKKQVQPNLSSSQNLLSEGTVKTPFHNAFAAIWRQHDSFGARHRVLRDFWPSVIEDPLPDSQSIEMLHLRLSYELLEKDHQLQGRIMPEKVRNNLEAARRYDLDALSGTVKALTKIALKSQEEGGMEDMAKNKTNRTGVVHLYLGIFEKQKEANLTDTQIADAIEKACGNRPTEKSVASYRCYFNQGTLAGQKSAPKEKLKAYRPKAEKVKKPMSEETKAKLKAYTAAKKKSKKTK